MRFPPVSIIIVTLNSARTLKECLNRINKQNYPKISEVLIVDGGSTDKTLEIAHKSKLPVKIVNGGYRDNQEARRGVGIKMAKSEICFLIDSDNYLVGNNWLRSMVEPLMEDPKIIATQTLRYSAPKDSSLFNRYFGLLGAADPVAYYLKKSDRLSFAFDKWNLLGKIIDENKRYYTIEFSQGKYPAVGCNGIALKRSIILKANLKNPEDYIHTDVFVDIGKLGFARFGIVKNEVFHNTAENITSFFGKRRRYMKLFHQRLNANRRHLTFDPKNPSDILHLVLFVIFALTFIEPFIESLRGYIKKRDIAWFIHPLVCFGIMLIYAQTTINNFIINVWKNIK
ncbi:MAG: hypothetical protein COU25_01135 [Candidatus Levybacteria bacterium CG10_big_fil_rev_8_21_14_0_10_35_13]|nr:MAG: hypothetical protein COU25_01135 [Candidatus Levybacteria bacterium CG10_big_fil_rev_8_21_14_0_10_35_13]